MTFVATGKDQCRRRYSTGLDCGNPGGTAEALRTAETAEEPSAHENQFAVGFLLGLKCGTATSASGSAGVRAVR